MTLRSVTTLFSTRFSFLSFLCTPSSTDCGFTSPGSTTENSCLSTFSALSVPQPSLTSSVTSLSKRYCSLAHFSELSLPKPSFSTSVSLGSSSMAKCSNPSSTDLATSFIGQYSHHYTNAAPGLIDNYTSGYCSTAAAIDGVQFKMDSNNISTGIIKMYGVS